MRFNNEQELNCGEGGGVRHERRRSKRLYRPTSPCFFTSPEHLFISPEHLHPLAEPRAAFGRRVLGATAGGLHHRHPLSHSTTHHSTHHPLGNASLPLYKEKKKEVHARVVNTHIHTLCFITEESQKPSRSRVNTRPIQHPPCTPPRSKSPRRKEREDAGP